jgi:hypothetical protein
MDNTNNIKVSTTTEKNDSKVLTVIVLDKDSNPTEGANVSIESLNTSEVTNQSGEASLILGNSKKYDVTVKLKGKTVTVPYYATEGGATRLIVNPVYIKSVESKLNPSWFSFSNNSFIISLCFGVIILIIIIWKFLKNKNKK